QLVVLLGGLHRDLQREDAVLGTHDHSLYGIFPQRNAISLGGCIGVEEIDGFQDGVQLVFYFKTSLPSLRVS
ncbi:hypothetical protein PENTCL1PPCAC_24071, partial [Pristionchus entomophagus]